MTSDATKALRDRRLLLWCQAKEIAEAAAEGSRAFTAAEQQRWDGIYDEMSVLDARLKQALEAEHVARDRAYSGRRAAEERRGYVLRARKLTLAELGY